MRFQPKLGEEAGLLGKSASLVRMPLSCDQSLRFAAFGAPGAEVGHVPLNGPVRALIKGEKLEIAGVGHPGSTLLGGLVDNKRNGVFTGDHGMDLAGSQDAGFRA